MNPAEFPRPDGHWEEGRAVRNNIEGIFLGISLVYLVVGMSLGIGMGVAEDFTYAHLHAHINLVGFVAHGFFGFAHRLWPGLRQSALAIPQLYLTIIGTPIFLIGIPLAQFQAQPLLAIVGSLMLLASALLFLVIFAVKERRMQSLA